MYVSIGRSMQYDTYEDAIEAVRNFEDETNSRYLTTKRHGEWYRKADRSVHTNVV